MVGGEYKYCQLGEGNCFLRLPAGCRTFDLSRVGGFLALHSPAAFRLQRGLAARGVDTDVRGAWLRFGPAPYLSDGQLREAMQALEPVAREVASGGGLQATKM